MKTHLEHEIEFVKEKVYNMADLAIEALVNAIECLKSCNVDLAQKVIQKDSEIDNLEIEIDEYCIRILVTKQPAAIDMRLVLALLKINTDIERIGDLASNIANEVNRLCGKPSLRSLNKILKMADIAVSMINDALQSMSNKDEKMAESVIHRDKEIDELNMQVYRELFVFIDEHHHAMSEALGLIMVSKALERIGDHATNIAEKTIYYIKGIDVRHSDN